jgi:hypothetical protein
MSILFDTPTWNEVPQPLFLSWSVARQLRYCADRDLDSSEAADAFGDNDLAFYYRERARIYLAQLETIRHTI